MKGDALIYDFWTGESWDGWQSWAEFVCAHSVDRGQAIQMSQFRNRLARNCVIGRIRLK